MIKARGKRFEECPHASPSYHRFLRSCALKLFNGTPHVTNCLTCPQNPNRDTDRPATPQPVPLRIMVKPDPTKWPFAVRRLYARRRPGEVGAGDTLQRLLGGNGERFKKWFKRIVGRAVQVRRSAGVDERPMAVHCVRRAGEPRYARWPVTTVRKSRHEAAMRCQPVKK